MRTTLLTLLKELAPRVPFPEPVYEFGSYRVPGQQHLPRVRDFFPGKKVVGCDIRQGPGVDQIQDLHELKIADGTIGTALMFDTIEHVRNPWRAMQELHRCLAPGGVLLMTSVWYFPIHAYPDDYWRFTSSGFSSLFQPFHEVAVDMCGMKRLPHTVVGVASKGPLDPGVERTFQDTFAAWKKNGSSTWKEAILDFAPPALLIPAYSLYLKIAGLLYRERESRAEAPAAELSADDRDRA